MKPAPQTAVLIQQPVPFTRRQIQRAADRAFHKHIASARKNYAHLGPLVDEIGARPVVELLMQGVSLSDIAASTGQMPIELMPTIIRLMF